jgi:tRNA(Ile)-lysidine synthase TilS/MesJ
MDSNTDAPSLKLATEATKPVGKESNKSKKNKGKIKPPAKMMRFITQAMIQWDMIQDGDRLLLGLSGGKDSLSLLHCLLEYQRKLPIKFDLEVCTIDPMTPSFDPSPLIPYVEGLGLKYHYIRDDIVERANTAGKDGKTVSSLCAFCARMKRGNLYTCARKNNCNKLVLAQHLDDCAESFFMSVFHNGFVRTMKANYQINAGDVSVIRPLVYCRESLMTEFAKANNLPVINENCPACFEEPKERARVKKLLSREETLYPNLYDHIRRALIPVMHDDSTAIMRSYTETALAKSRKVPPKQKEEEKRQDDMVVDDSSAPSCKNNQNGSTASTSLASASEEELIAELAKRRAEKYKLSGAMKRLDDNTAEGSIEDPTGQMCSLHGGDGTIPCRELME